MTHVPTTDILGIKCGGVLHFAAFGRKWAAKGGKVLVPIKLVISRRWPNLISHLRLHGSKSGLGGQELGAAAGLLAVVLVCNRHVWEITVSMSLEQTLPKEGLMAASFRALGEVYLTLFDAQSV